jgi:hypothetical protein
MCFAKCTIRIIICAYFQGKWRFWAKSFLLCYWTDDPGEAQVFTIHKACKMIQEIMRHEHAPAHLFDHSWTIKRYGRVYVVFDNHYGRFRIRRRRKFPATLQRLLPSGRMPPLLPPLSGMLQ